MDLMGLGARKQMDRCMARLQELQYTVTDGAKVLSGVSLSPRSTRGYLRTIIHCKQETVRVFDVNLKENLSNIEIAYKGLITTMVITTAALPNGSMGCLVSLAHIVVWGLVGFAKAAVQALVFAIVLLPLAVLYIGGLYISMGISLWRLIQRDYGIADEDDSKANLKPALVVLYSLALLQGALFCYRSIYVLYGNKLVEALTIDWAYDLRVVVRDYLRETCIGCEKDPSFARGRNLAIHAVELIESNSPSGFLRGSMYLDALLRSPSCRPTTGDDHDIIKQLIGSTSSSHVLQKLMATLDPRSPYSNEMRKYAMRIVSHLADEIWLDRFPIGIQCITSLTRSSMEELVQTGLHILERLAADEANFIVMSNTQGILSCIMAPLTSDGVIQCHLSDTTWHSIAEISLQLIGRFMAHGTKLRGEITSIHGTVSAMEHILKGDTFCGCLQKRATEILMDLPLDTSSKRSFISLLIDKLVNCRMSRNTRDFAGEKLPVLSLESIDDATIVLPTNDDLIGDLAAVLVDDEVDITCRLWAAEILKHLCGHYTKDEECFRLERAWTMAMTQVLTGILHCALRPINPTARHGYWDSTHFHKPLGCTTSELALEISKETNKKRRALPCFHCLLGPDSTSGELRTCSCIKQRDEYDQLKEAMIFLCEMICDKFISDKRDMAWQLGKIATDFGFRSEEDFTTLASFMKFAEEHLDSERRAGRRG